MTDLHWTTASDAARAIATGQLSPVELTRSLLARIRDVDPRLHSFVTIDADKAMEAAHVAEAEVRAGRLRGELHGVPVGVKDIIDVAGLPTTCQSRIMAGNIAAEDAICVRRLRDAGAIILGKLATHEFATGGPGFDVPWPPPRNPWNPDHHPGGSSSGSGAAVAGGLLPLALGTDTGGSVRHPASACGIVGLKPTYGRVSRRGVFPLSATLDTVGTMARTVTDAALMLEVIAGHDALDPGSDPRAATCSLRDGIDEGVKGLRIGFVRHFHESDMQADDEMSAALQQAAHQLSEQGAVVCDVRLPTLGEMGAATWALIQSYAWTIHAKWLRERPAEYGRYCRRRLMIGAFLTAEDLVRANCQRLRIVQAVDATLRDVDVLLCASMMEPACRIDDFEQLEISIRRQARTPFSLTGHPALAMRSGLSSDGLPLSLQFVGRYFDEATVLRVARSWERAAGTDQSHPSI